MSFMPWDPFSDLRALRERIDRLFEESLTRTTRQETSAVSWAPVVDIYETDETLVVEAELPGIKQDEIEIELNGDTLSVKGERKAEPKRDYLRQERVFGTFMRTFSIGIPIDHAQIKARFRNGLLQITLPKAEATSPQQVKVEIS